MFKKVISIFSTIAFDTPVYNFRFYSEYYGSTFVAGENRGRICIGDMTLQFQKNNYMPLNWHELEFEPEKWDGVVEGKNNCYDCAINNQVVPGTNNLYDKQQPGTYKVALVAFSRDYHWYRQDSDGTWSHKPGGNYVTNKDYSNNLILDPQNCDRNAGGGLNYNLFVGYFAISPLG